MSDPSTRPAPRDLQPPPREFLTPLLSLLAAGLLIIWQLRLYRDNPLLSLLAWLALGLAALGAGYLLTLRAPLPETLPEERATPFPSIPVRRFVAVYLGITGLLFAYLAVSRLWLAPENWSASVGEMALAVALLLFAAALFDSPLFDSPLFDNPLFDSALFDSLLSRPGRGRYFPFVRLALFKRTGIVHATLFVAILLLAVVLRVYRLDQSPVVFVDETNAGLDAIALLEGRLVSPFATGWYETPNAFIYWMAGLFKLLGANYLSLKLVSLLPGMLTVSAVYFLARALFGPAAGLIGMFLFAISRWHLMLSRWGWNEVATPLFFALAALFLWRGLRKRRALDFALGGLLAGLMSYTYLSSRLALITLAVFALYWLAVDPQGPRSEWRRIGAGLMLFAVVAGVVIAPLAVTYLSAPQIFWNRMGEVGIWGDVARADSFAPLWENVWDHLRVFYQRGDPTGRHNLPGEPQADPITGLFLAVGVALALLRLRDRRRGLLLIWLILGLAGGFLSERLVQPNTYRTLNALVPIAILAGESIDRVGQAIHRALRGQGASGYSAAGRFLHPTVARILPPLFVCCLLLAAGAWETRLFFGSQLSSPEVQSSFSYTEMQVAQEVLGLLDSPVAVYLSPRLYDFSPLRFLVWGAIRARGGHASLFRLPYRVLRPALDLPVPSTGSDALFLLDPYYESVVDDYLRLFYPNAQVRMETGPRGQDSYLRVWIPAGDLAALQGLRAEVHRRDGSAETISSPSFQLGAAGEAVTSVRWTGSLRLGQSGVYELIVEGDGQLYVDGLPWAGSRYLAQGLHRLEMEQDGPASIGLSWRRPDGIAETVPARVLFNLPPPQQGLWASYYANENWSGPPLMEQITPFLLLAWPINEPLVHPFSATYTGLLRVERAGFYRFRVEADDGVRFALDGDVLGAALVPARPNRVEVGLELAAGDHPVQIDYFQTGGGSALEFFWTPPGEGEVPVPPSALLPGQ